MIPGNEFYICSILTKEMIIFCSHKDKNSTLRKLGAKRKWFFSNEWSLKFDSKEKELELLMAINEIGAAFSYHPGRWGPSCVFMHYRDKGLVTGTIKRISWKGNGKFNVEEV